MTENIILPELIESEIDALVKCGMYSSKSELLRKAFLSLWEGNTELKIAASIRMFLDKEISLAKAAQIAGLNREEFKNVLRKKGIKIEISSPSLEKLTEQVKLIRKSRKSK